MNPQTDIYLNPRAKRFVSLGIIFVVLVCLYEIGLSLYTYQTTGVLSLSSSDKNAALSVSQADHNAKVIGAGSGKVRLKPGSYTVSATDNGYQTSTTVAVQARHKTSQNLKLAAAASSPDSGKLLALLPYLGSGDRFRISSTVQSNGASTGPVLIITSSSPQTQQIALQWIQDRGFNPSDYTIKYQTAQLRNYHYTEGIH
ncbi:MAG: hypothetical protein JWS12_957 [Candidatus Saccharibacteria bacterium]|nr:hypothetical protein [Candidatus Saccharibacteria bacterium]